VSALKLKEALFVGYRVRLFVLLLAIALLAPMLVAAQEATPVHAATPAFGYRVVSEYPHDRRAYTQGLVYIDGVLYEGTGQYGKSTLRRVDLETGEVLQAVGLSKEYFGEGIAVLGDRIYQLTWKSGICVVFDRATFELLEVFTYQTEGWGLTTDGEQLIMSDGTNRLFIRDPETFAELDTIDVYDGVRAIWNLNELEIVDGEIWANVWQTDHIARIDPETGQVTGWIDLTGLLSESDRRTHRVDVLNGIAHDPETDRLFVTGKLWPKLFEIEVVPR
jgi:glutaminyl-peptide cyclotransferase